jgi:hypothetical protein
MPIEPFAIGAPCRKSRLVTAPPCRKGRLVTAHVAEKAVWYRRTLPKTPFGDGAPGQKQKNARATRTEHAASRCRLSLVGLSTTPKEASPRLATSSVEKKKTAPGSTLTLSAD